MPTPEAGLTPEAAPTREPLLRPDTALIRQVVARNDAEAAENAIHHDDVAPRYGFRGGLVPGVTVYAYLSVLPATRWGRTWLEQGTMTARFTRPVYDGEAVELHLVPDPGDPSRAELEAIGPDGTVRVTGHAALGGADGSQVAPAVPDQVPMPEPADRPPASEDVLASVPLGTFDRRWTAASQAEMLAAVGEGPASWPWPDVAHPGWLLRGANDVLWRSVRLGPWMHVSSDVTHLGTVTEGQLVSTRGRVTGLFERRGHRFVELDVVVLADERPVWSVRHVAIYEPKALEGSRRAERA